MIFGKKKKKNIDMEKTREHQAEKIPLIIDESTESKFEKEKVKNAICTVIHIYRNNKLNLPMGKEAEFLLAKVKEIDPEQKLSEREIVDKILADDNLRMEFIKELDKSGGNPISDEVLRKYAEEHYRILRNTMADPTPKSWDAQDYHTQQMLSIVNKDNAEKYFKIIMEIMDNDPTCPFFIKKSFKAFPFEPEKTKIPTKEDEELAEKIISAVNPKVERKTPDVYRALVDAIKWRGKEELEKTYKAVMKTPKEKRKLRGRESCLFIESDEGVHYIG